MVMLGNRPSLVLLILAASGSISFGLQIEGHRREGPKEEPKEPADSEIVEGPDCGHVSSVIGKFSKSAKVGKLLGQASGAVGQADSASDTADSAAEKAKDLAKAAAKVGGAEFKAAEDAAKDAKKASEDATSASTDLQSQYDKVKDSLGETDGAGYGAKDADVTELKDMKKKAVAATKKALSSAENALKRGEAAKQAALKNADAAVEVIGVVSKAAAKKVKESKEFQQKAKFVADDAKKYAEKAKEVLGKVEKKVDDAGDQKPVWEALHGNLDAEIGDLEEKADELETKIDDLKTATEEADTKAEPMNEALEKAKTEHEGKLNQSNTHFKNTRVTSCSGVLMKNGKAVCLAFKGQASKPIDIAKQKSSETTSVSHDTFQPRLIPHAGMTQKKLERYHPTAKRNLLA